MTGFDQITGHEETIRHLRDSVRLGKVNHAYIIEGPEGFGKRTIASAFAQALECEHTDIAPCGECHSCRQASSGSHPDIKWVLPDPEKPGQIRVDDIRTQIVSDVAILPYQGKYKVYIVPEAEKMNPAAQNALLKTLEEPPSYAVILLLTKNAASFLETIRSRCVLLALKPVREAQIEEYLMKHVQIPDYQARLCAAFAQGSIGMALRLATSAQFQELREEGVSLVRRIRDLSVTELIIYIKELAERRNKSKESYPDFVKDYLDILTVWFRDVLYFKATRDADRLIFRDQLQLIRARSQVSSYEGIETILQALDKARQRLDASVSFELTMELLFLTIKEN